jgi:hypothetical protein
MIAPPKPPVPEPEALIPEARERQRRRRLVGTVGVAVVAAVALGVYAIATRSDASRRNDSPSSALVTAPRCRVSQLSASAYGLNGGGFGTMNGFATLTNVSDNACSLPRGRPDVRIHWQGRIVPTRETRARSNGQALLLAAHSRATIPLTWGNWCGKPSEGTVSWIRPTFRLRFADGLEIHAPGSVATPPGCLGNGESSLSVGPVRLMT